MSSIVPNQKLLETLRRIAKKKKKREDSSLCHTKLLNELSSQYGYATFDSLQRRVRELEQQALDGAVAAEEAQWRKRFEGAMVWGSVSRDGLEETFPLPVIDGSVCWPNCFCASSLFTCADGPRRQIEGPLDAIDQPEMEFHGEELRVGDDETILMALISAAGKYPCGRLVEFSTADLDKVLGQPLPELGIPIQYDAIARSLWRLVHCDLTVNDFMFKGPILAYADARQGPQHFAIRFNPNFANFFYPFLKMFG